MKCFFLVFFFLSSLVLTGCGIGGFWMNGNPNPTPTQPYGAHWIKEGMTRESRRQDSWACGAAKTVHAADHVVFTPEQRQSVRTQGEKDDFGPDKRLLDQWRVCMGSKSYTYLEQCDARCLHP
jgi:hypothetical protein